MAADSKEPTIEDQQCFRFLDLSPGMAFLFLQCVLDTDAT